MAALALLRRLPPPHNDRAMPFDVIIPARDEAPTVAAVVRAARAEVIPSRGNGSKAQALATGVDATSSDVLVFFDADVIGAEPAHFERLAAAVTGGFAMSLGLIDYGRLRNAIYARLPPIT